MIKFPHHFHRLTSFSATKAILMGNPLSMKITMSSFPFWEEWNFSYTAIQLVSKGHTSSSSSSLCFSLLLVLCPLWLPLWGSCPAVSWQSTYSFQIFLNVVRNFLMRKAYTMGLTAELPWLRMMAMGMRNNGLSQAGQKRVMLLRMWRGSQLTAKRKRTRASDLASLSSLPK